MKIGVSMDNKTLAAALAVVILAGLFVGYAMTPSSSGRSPCDVPKLQGPVAGPESASTGGSDAFGDDSEIGKPCNADSDCKLPMSYAIRSSCPFAMRCSNGSCEVYCPWNDSVQAADSTPVDNTTAGQPQEVIKNSTSGNATLLLFWAIGCPHCAEEKEFLERIRGDYPELAVTSYEVSKSDENVGRLRQMCAERGISCDNVPLTFVGRTVFKSYKGDEGGLTRYAGEQSYVGYGSQIENAIRRELGLPAKEDPNAWRRDLRFSAATDKALYYEKEPINITAVVYSSANVTGCYVKARGIEHSGKYYVDESEMVNLKAGNNTVVLQGRAPACFGCANFKPGDYDIGVWLERAGEKLKEVTLTIEIRDKE
jgi:thiol-disulfide isomerase/thioredoxin